MNENKFISIKDVYDKKVDFKNKSINGVALDMWGTKSIKSQEESLSENEFLKSFKILLLKMIVNNLNSEKIDIMVYGGTALSVWRDEGKMIPHDHDIDLAILEKDFLKVYKSINKEKDIFADSICPCTGNPWFNEDCSEQIIYNKVGVKRMKVYFHESYLKSMSKVDNNFQKLMSNYDKSKLCIDIFMLQKRNESNCLFITWHLEDFYDSDRKGFPENVILPMKSYLFEGINVLGPNDIKRYLEIEYGYLGKDARYDYQQQLYVKMKKDELEILPDSIKNYMLH